MAGFMVCSRLARFLAAALLIASLWPSVPTARAGDMSHRESTVTGEPSMLDGQVFSGTVGAMGKETRSSDTWIFEDGTFRSLQCEDCGFPRGVYQTLREGDKISFVAETPCPVTDARIVWRGTIEDGHIKGVYTWTRKRWYRTIEKEFWFEGTLGRSAQAAAGD